MLNPETHRFYWWSLDHRGTPETPGRVVNIMQTDNLDDEVWGVAYEIDDAVWNKEVGQQLDHREKGGYERTNEKFCTKDGKTWEITVYQGSLEDEQYAGPAPLEEMAKTIYETSGPSGSNKEYLYNLADSLRDVIGVEDEHVFELERAVKDLESKHLSL